MNHITLAIEQREDFHAPVMDRVHWGVRNVRVNLDGHLKTGRDWRDVYCAWLRRVLPPQWWIYRGGHHLAIHASAPAEPRWSRSQMRQTVDNEAGPCLFRILEVV